MHIHMHVLFPNIVLITADSVAALQMISEDVGGAQFSLATPIYAVVAYNIHTTI